MDSINQSTDNERKYKLPLPPKRRQQRGMFGSLILPAFLVQFVLAEVPFVVTIWLAFERWNFQLFPNKSFTGFGNFRNILSDGTFLPSVQNTVELVAMTLPAVAIIGTIAAKALNLQFAGRGVARTLVLTPFFVPPAAASYAFNDIIYRPASGLWSYFLGPLGAPSSVATSWPLPSVALVEIWEWTPLATLIILAGLQAIPPDVIEAAGIDGVGWFGAFWRIELPLLRRAILVGVSISAIFIFQSFDAVQIITQGGPGNESMTIAYYIYREVFENFDVGGGEAAGLVMLFSVIIVATLARIAYQLVRSSQNRTYAGAAQPSRKPEFKEVGA
jgi:sorbitol/mannitol transport system permease protein